MKESIFKTVLRRAFIEGENNAMKKQLEKPNVFESSHDWIKQEKSDTMYGISEIKLLLDILAIPKEDHERVIKLFEDNISKLYESRNNKAI